MHNEFKLQKGGVRNTAFEVKDSKKIRSQGQEPIFEDRLSQGQGKKGRGKAKDQRQNFS